MMSPQEVLTGCNQRTIAPRTQPYIAKQEAPRGSRDDKRRAQHNEVERRRRDKINNWIVHLSKAIPDCNIDYTKTGQSKGGILSKACEYIKELRQSNLKLGDDISTLDRLRIDNQLLRQEVRGQLEFRDHSIYIFVTYYKLYSTYDTISQSLIIHINRYRSLCLIRAAGLQGSTVT
ncbi:upstream stimulatory factor 1-like, partial [Anarrhichthys ocellatus]|uniref:upstream stimulatory factor 1-like n=1 Tax=Anarrhichthys ocellatus TaxID=433405 RepID=UPI0012ED5F82